MADTLSARIVDDMGLPVPIAELKTLDEQQLLDAWAGVRWLDKQLDREFARRKRAKDRAAKKTSPAAAR